MPDRVGLQQCGQVLVVADVLGLDDVLAGDALGLRPADAAHLIAGGALLHEGVPARLHRPQHHLDTEAAQSDQVLPGVGLAQLVRDGGGWRSSPMPDSPATRKAARSFREMRPGKRCSSASAASGAEVGDAAFDDVAAVIQAPMMPLRLGASKMRRSSSNLVTSAAVGLRSSTGPPAVCTRDH